MLKSILCDYSDACILVSGTIPVNRAGDDDHAKRLDKRNKKVIFQNYPAFTGYISKRNNT